MKPAPGYEKQIGAVMLLGEDGSLLMQLRDEIHGLPYAGKWSIPSGRRESGESFEQCARRELLEETGYVCETLKELITMDDTDDTGSYYQLAVFWACYDGTQELKCLEGQAARFIRRSEIAIYPMPGFISGIWDMAIERFTEQKRLKAK